MLTIYILIFAKQNYYSFCLQIITAECCDVVDTQTSAGDIYHIYLDYACIKVDITLVIKLEHLNFLITTLYKAKTNEMARTCDENGTQ